MTKPKGDKARLKRRNARLLEENRALRAALEHVARMSAHDDSETIALDARATLEKIDRERPR